jgi:hypothetical protein
VYRASPSLRGANGSRERAPDDRLRDEAIQLSLPRQSWIASLRSRRRLKHACPFPRLVFARVVVSRWPSLGQRAQGKPGADCARSPVCEECYRRAHGFNYRYSRDIPAFPAQWLYGLYVLSPGKRPFLPPLLAGLTANVAPGSRRQDHTISPYAACVSSGASTCAASVHRNPRQRSVTTAKRPLARARAGKEYSSD